MRQVIFLFSILFSTNAISYIDLSLRYTFSKSIIEVLDSEGVINEAAGRAVTTNQGTSAGLAWYIWEYTAVEFNYSRSVNEVNDTRGATTSDDTLTIESLVSSVVTTVSGMGIRQSFAHRKATFIPSISIGFAEYVTSGNTTYQLNNNGAQESITIEQDTQKQSSSYASLQLRIRITELIGLSFAAKTVMPDFDTSAAENNVTYSAGFSWVF